MAPPGAGPATDTGEGASSAQLLVPGEPASIAGFYADALRDRGLMAGTEGALEDGSFVVSGSDGYGCAAQVTVLPTGAGNLVTVLYGAGCPFE